MTSIQLTWEQWEDQFKPLSDEHGIRWFETYGEDWEQVKSAIESNPETVWTVVDGEGVYLDVINGAHWVNRLNYFITELPAETKTDYYITNNNEGK